MVSYDCLQGEDAIATTIAAAKYLASQRHFLQPRSLVLVCQGASYQQYLYCARKILEHTDRADWLGLGGWKGISERSRKLPFFFDVIRELVPEIAQAKVKRLHLFGVLSAIALAPLLWMCDEYGLTLSSDSTRPMLEVVRGCSIEPYWKDNVDWWQQYALNLRHSAYYREPPCLPRQLSLF